MNQRRGFTLIELLVVIAIIALLLSIIVPSLKKVKEQAKKTICQTHLHQWGLAYEMYLNDYDMKFTPGWEGSPLDGKYVWVYAIREYYQDPGIRFCPKANRTPSEGGKMPWGAWDLRDFGWDESTGFSLIIDEHGSYGENWWITSETSYVDTYPDQNKWKKGGIAGASQIPVLGDCGFLLLRPMETDIPPAYDGDFFWDGTGGMKRTCHNRHTGGVNWLFMDWSVRNVGLKQLWGLRWHRNWETPRNIAWPDWMDNL